MPTSHHHARFSSESVTPSTMSACPICAGSPKPIARGLLQEPARLAPSSHRWTKRAGNDLSWLSCCPRSARSAAARFGVDEHGRQTEGLCHGRRSTLVRIVSAMKEQQSSGSWPISSRIEADSWRGWGISSRRSSPSLGNAPAAKAEGHHTSGCFLLEALAKHIPKPGREHFALERRSPFEKSASMDGPPESSGC